jgi:hypothetical protein
VVASLLGSRTPRMPVSVPERVWRHERGYGVPHTRGRPGHWGSSGTSRGVDETREGGCAPVSRRLARPEAGVRASGCRWGVTPCRSTIVRATAHRSAGIATGPGGGPHPQDNAPRGATGLDSAPHVGAGAASAGHRGEGPARSASGWSRVGGHRGQGDSRSGGLSYRQRASHGAGTGGDTPCHQGGPCGGGRGSLSGRGRCPYGPGGARAGGWRGRPGRPRGRGRGRRSGRGAAPDGGPARGWSRRRAGRGLPGAGGPRWSRWGRSPGCGREGPTGGVA